MKRCIQTDISCDYVHSSIVIYISKSKASPKSWKILQPTSICCFDQLASLILKNTNRHPVASNDKLRLFIIVQIYPGRRIQQSGIFKCRTYGSSYINEFPMLIMQQI